MVFITLILISVPQTNKLSFLQIAHTPTLGDSSMGPHDSPDELPPLGDVCDVGRCFDFCSDEMRNQLVSFRKVMASGREEQTEVFSLA